MRFVGDLSENDAVVLESYGRQSKSILEFGAGGSTQIFAQCLPSVLVSIETDPAWIDKTSKNLALIEKKTMPWFSPYEDIPTGEYDLIFVDGIWHKRLDFAVKTWPMLREYGYMIFHDTLRNFDAEIAFKVASKFYDEITRIYVNENWSNCTIIYKSHKRKYENWNETEGKPKWLMALGMRQKGSFGH